MTLTTVRWAVLVVACCLAAACGSSGSSSSSAPGSGSVSGSGSASGSASGGPVCDDARALRGSLEKLGTITVSKNTASELSGDLTQVKSDLDKLASDADGQWDSQVSSLKSALTKTQTAVSDLTSGNGSAGAVTSSLAGLATSATNLLSRVATHCAT